MIGRIVVIITLIILSVGLLAGCKTEQVATYDLSLTIQDDEGNPLVEAKVVIDGVDYFTGINGVVDITGLTQEVINISISKTNFETIEDSITLSPGSNIRTFAMAKTTEAEETNKILSILELNSYVYRIEIGKNDQAESVLEYFAEKPDKWGYRIYEGTEKVSEVIIVDGVGKMWAAGAPGWVDYPVSGNPYESLIIGQADQIEEFSGLGFVMKNQGEFTMLGYPVTKWEITGSTDINQFKVLYWKINSGEFKDLMIKAETHTLVGDIWNYVKIEATSINQPLNITLP